MREVLPDKSPGDPLSAQHVNILSDGARAALDQNPESYRIGKQGRTTNPPPFTQSMVVVVEIDDVSDESSSSSSTSSGSEFRDIGTIYDVRRLYYDHLVDSKWKENDEDGPWELDTTGFNLLLTIGDIIPAWYDPQRGAFVPTSFSRKLLGRTVRAHSKGDTCPINIYSKDAEGIESSSSSASSSSSSGSSESSSESGSSSSGSSSLSSASSGSSSSSSSLCPPSTKGREDFTGVVILAYNRFADLAVNVFVHVEWIDGGWELTAGEC